MRLGAGGGCNIGSSSLEHYHKTLHPQGPFSGPFKPILEIDSTTYSKHSGGGTWGWGRLQHRELLP